MNRNIEIKARIHHLEAVQTLASELSGRPPQVSVQEDVFFNTPTGRLKLRLFSPEQGELIAYTRPDTSGPKLSQYLISPTSEPDSLRAALAASLGIIGAVRKRRVVYLVGQTRVHLDEVENLGSFLELEVVLSPEQTTQEGEKVAQTLMQALGVEAHDLVPCAYIDLLTRP